MSILVNGIPKEEEALFKCLRQGDLLASFLFLMVADSLNGFLRNVVAYSKLDGFKVGKYHVEISHFAICRWYFIRGVCKFKKSMDFQIDIEMF